MPLIFLFLPQIVTLECGAWHRFGQSAAKSAHSREAFISS